MEYVKEYWEILNIIKTVFYTETGTYLLLFLHVGIWNIIKNGRRHRDNGPAVIRKDGVCSWYKNGVHLVTC